MNNILELFDRLTEKIPPDILKKVRIALLSLWFLIAVVVAFYSWKIGTSNAPQKGQDLYLSEIKEKAEIEKNLKRAPDVTVPDVHDLVPGDDSISGPVVRSPYRRGLDDESNSDTKKGGDLPPFLGEKTEPVFPSRTGEPGMGSESENRLEPTTKSDENEMPLLPPGEQGAPTRRDSSQPPATGFPGTSGKNGSAGTKRKEDERSRANRPGEGEKKSQQKNPLFQDRWKKAEPLMNE